jgi:hypothetical protein
MAGEGGGVTYFTTQLFFSLSTAWHTAYREGKEIRQGGDELKNCTGAIYKFYTLN